MESFSAEARHRGVALCTVDREHVHEVSRVPENSIHRLPYLEIPVGQTTSQCQIQETPVTNECVSPGGAAKGVIDYRTNEFVNSRTHSACLRVLELSASGREATAL